MATAKKKVPNDRRANDQDAAMEEAFEAAKLPEEDRRAEPEPVPEPPPPAPAAPPEFVATGHDGLPIQK